jgi:uncharacterized protein (DUF2235 family)
MARNLVLLSDGTGNSAGKLFKTNVWRTYRALNLSNANQVAFYDDGVGTSSLRPLALLGGAFGWGLKRNILERYMFLCRHYAPGDRIFGFGFSRGAFTIRVLTKFILSEGLVTNYGSARDLKRKSLELYRAFRKKETTGSRFSELIRSTVYLLRSILFGKSLGSNGIERQRVASIEFLGLWDTVDAYGLPIEELKIGIDRFVWPLALMDRQLDHRVTKACHALSIDDSRKTFHPLLWDETNELQSSEASHTDDERLTQVWFAGVHSNVGGGYPDDGLSFLSLRWMMHEARKRGLILNGSALKEADANAAPFGRLYHSRAGLGAYYRYEPRRLNQLIDRQGAQILCPKIHESVIWRMALDAGSYAPLSLPTKLRIITDVPNGNTSLNRGAKARNIYEFSHYQDAVTANDHSFDFLIGSNFDKKTQEQIAVKINALQKPNLHAVELMWDTVWWRQVAYFITLAATVWLICYPKLNPLLGDFVDIEKVGRIFNGLPGAAVIGQVAEVIEHAFEPIARFSIEVAISFLPHFTQRWFGGYLEPAWGVILLCFVIAILLRWGALIDHRIRDRALAAWNKDWELRRFQWSQGRTTRRIVSSLIVFCTFGLCTLLVISMYRKVQSNLHLSEHRCSSESCPELSTETEVMLFLVVAACIACSVCIVALGYTIWAYRRTKQGMYQKRELPGLALCLSRMARTWRCFRWVHRYTTRCVAPAFCAALVVIGGLALISRMSFAFINEMNGVCTEIPGYHLLEPSNQKTLDFDITKGCFDSETKLESGKRYRIEVARGDSVPNGWWKLTWPIRRYLAEPWFVPIVRVGSTRPQEFILADLKGVIEPTKEGRLFIFLNDAVIGVPGVWDWFYRLRGGKAWKVVVTRCMDSETRSQVAC